MNYLELLLDDGNVKLNFERLIGSLDCQATEPVYCTLAGLDNDASKFALKHPLWKQGCEAKLHKDGNNFFINDCQLQTDGIPSRNLNVVFQLITPC